MVDKDSRSKLIDAALPLFAVKGYAAVSIRELAEAAGVNVALINYHFGGKEGLYAAVIESQFSRLDELLKPVATMSSEPSERIRAYVKNIVTEHQRSPHLRRLIASELSNPTPCFEKVVKKNVKNFFPKIHTVLSDGMTQSFRPDLNPPMAAIAIAGMIQFYFLAQPIVDELIPPYNGRDEDYLREVLNIFFQGIHIKDGG